MSRELLLCAGKKESDKKSREGAAKESSLVLFFVAISTSSGYDLQLSTSSCPSFKSGMEMHRFMMHAHTCPTIAKMEARMELALSSTTRLDVDMATMTIDEIPDICTEEGGGVHTDGAGFISLDLAKLCPSVMFRGTQLEGARNKKIEEVHSPSQCHIPPPFSISSLTLVSLVELDGSGVPPAAPGACVSRR